MKKNSYFLIVSMGLLCGILNGILGSGGGIIAVLLLNYVFKLKNKKAHATSISIILPLSIISSYILVKNGIYDFSLIIQVGIGSIIGAIIGAKVLNKISNNMISRIFGIAMVISAIRMMF
ncbi:TSUP family transporter [Alkalibaculum sp. M08DMB]|uniref:Probable membrane transporter protein n=1 Tax=Alkalibaculum sporogenes TaxID=2655001 RepID=A0A6A7KD11_9FIRM|nr:TSUP family transporter [Alkalibaculum sporogenes]MPW27057.1 TSUP family transporter [Alkalibaculum sporogenes]